MDKVGRLHGDGVDAVDQFTDEDVPREGFVAIVYARAATGAEFTEHEVERFDQEARVLGAIIARPWLIGHCGVLVPSSFSDWRNQAAFAAITGVQSTHGQLPKTATAMGLAIMRNIDGAQASDRVDLTYLASLVTVAEQALGQFFGEQRVEEWFAGVLDELLLRNPRQA